MSIQIYHDEKTEVHVGDTVRYIRYDYLMHGRFYGKTGTVTGLWENGSGLDVHFPHYARGTNLSDLKEYFRLVRGKEITRGRQDTGGDAGQPEIRP